jgi:hypothetical protein
MSFMFTWLRLSSNRLLDWQRCFSYQPRDITWAQQQVSCSSLHFIVSFCLFNTAVGCRRQCNCSTSSGIHIDAATSPATSLGHGSR